MKKQFNELIKSEELKEITTDLIESVIDDSITNEVLKEIPILKSLIAAKNIYTSISDQIFIKKAMYVLMELGDVNWKQRIELLDILKEDHSSGTEVLMMHIDKLESIEKCKVFGRLCRIKVEKRIDKYDFLRIANLIKDCFLDDLEVIRHFKPDKSLEINVEDYYHPISLGLLVQENVYLPKNTTVSKYILSLLGKMLIQHYDELILNQSPSTR